MAEIEENTTGPGNLLSKARKKAGLSLAAIAEQLNLSIEIIKQLDRSSGHMQDLPAQLSKLFKSFMAGTQHGFASTCPECSGRLVFEEGCEICHDCGYSKCS